MYIKDRGRKAYIGHAGSARHRAGQGSAGVSVSYHCFRMSLYSNRACIFLSGMKCSEGEFSLLSMHQYPYVFRYAKSDTLVLCCLASKLSRGSWCTCDPSQTPAYGCFNWAILIMFEGRGAMNPPFPKRGQVNRVWGDGSSAVGQWSCNSQVCQPTLRKIRP